MTLRSLLILAAAGVLAGSSLLFSQTNVTAFEAELSVPFGTAHGTLLLLDDDLVFVDELQLSDSFVIPRDLIDKVAGGSQMITVETKRPVRDRSGERESFSFRLLPGVDPVAVTRWHQASVGTASGVLAEAPVPGVPVSTAVKPVADDEKVYQASHNHRLGACRGRFVVGTDRIVYESIDNIGHSRKWLLKDIKELKLDNPYTLNIDPFSGGKYTIHFEGQGMEPDVFASLVDGITSARIARQ